MKNFKKNIILTIFSLTCIETLIHADGGGAFGGALAGSMIGTGIMVAATNSGNRAPRSVASEKYRDAKEELKRVRAEKRKLERQLDKATDETKRANLQKQIDAKKKKIKHLKSRIYDIDDNDSDDIDN